MQQLFQPFARPFRLDEGQWNGLEERSGLVLVERSLLLARAQPEQRFPLAQSVLRIHRFYGFFFRKGVGLGPAICFQKAKHRQRRKSDGS